MSGAVVLLSGGVDSTTLLRKVCAERGAACVHALSFRYGQKHARELDAAAAQADMAGARHTIADVGVFGELTAGGSALTDADIQIPDLDAVPEASRAQPSTYVPNRNMMLLSMAAAYAESHDIADVFYGAQIQDEYGYWDCTATFLERINAVLQLNRRTPIQIHAPFVGLRKAEVVGIGVALGVDYGQTWTCYRGGATACSTCPSCVERARAFEEAGVPDPLVE